ncbi:MAG: hypothetical protein ACD_49C00055G0006 [uncultured bacterium (gcode 4)]|uniref:Lipoprotein n=1 Tax=uncultured bacterium (gcode 4) TaxID=1234023 RepID=K2BVK9_9BACT|nr:MAG: hypothetical protein ACD_49C00055G0006 [uncultured bacterium (gcode 4)]
MKKIKFIIFAIILSSLLVSCSFLWFWKKEKDLPYYKNIWQDTFRLYQKNITNIDKKGKFDFEFTTMAQWSGSIDNFWNIDFEEKFSSLSFKTFWEYNFSDISTPNLDANIKIYLNKRAFWEWDIDLRLHLYGSWNVEYEIKNLTPNILKFLKIDSENIDNLMLAFEENKWKIISNSSYSNYLSEIIKAFIESSKKDKPLVENTKQEEAQIIDSFLKNEVIQILSWKETESSSSELNFKFNWVNFVNFLNDVAKIIKEEKDFSSDKDFFKDFSLWWTLEIKDNKLINSNTNLEIPISTTDIKTWEKKYELLIFQNNFKMPSPEKFDIDFTTLFFSNSNPDNKLQLRFRWIIK